MKTSSWEIILAGFIFVGVAIYLVEQKSESPTQKETALTTDSIRVKLNGENLRVIHLKNLSNLENIENLKNLQNLKNLENLKNLTNFLPVEFQAEFESEIDEVIQEFEQQDVSVSIDTEKGTVSIDKNISVNTGRWNTVSPGVFVYVNEFDAAQLHETELYLPFGSIEVKGTSEPTAKFTIQASGQVSSRAELESKIKTQESFGNNKAVFKVTSQGRTIRDKNIHLQATLSVPKNSRLTTETNGGHISSENIDGKQHYLTRGGHITLKNVEGEVDAKTNGGHISVYEGNGALTLNSMGGHVRAENSSGVIKMKTSGGNVHASNIDGELEASTNGGNIEIHFLKITQPTNATTGAGTITFWIPRSANTDINASGNSVEIDSGLNYSGSNTSGTAKGKIGNGGPVIKAKTNYGKVILKSVD